MGTTRKWILQELDSTLTNLEWAIKHVARIVKIYQQDMRYQDYYNASMALLTLLTEARKMTLRLREVV